MYRLRDFLMFSPRTYNRLFEHYNHDVWPLQLLALAVGIVILIRPRVTAPLLAIAWLWVAYAFFWQRFSTIHTFAKWFAIAFAVEALLLCLYRGTSRAALVLFAVVLFVYPIIPPRHEMFGIAPDPTALGTLLLAARWRERVIPILWCAFSAATLLAMAMR